MASPTVKFRRNRAAASLLLLVAIIACSSATDAVPPLASVEPVANCSFLSFDISTYSTWGFERRLQVRADGSVILEAYLRDDAWRPRGSPRPFRSGELGASRLAALCALLDERTLDGLSARYVQQTVFDGPATVLEVRLPGRTLRIYDYGDSGPECLHTLDDLLDEAVQNVAWTVWTGDEATWLERTGWMPLADWRRELNQHYPPWPN